MMRSYSTSDLSRRAGDIIASALRAPVKLTQHSKPRLVLLSIEDYESLLARADVRKVHTLDSMPDELARQAEAALRELDSASE